MLAFHLHVVNLLRRRQDSPASLQEKKEAVFSTSFLADMPVPLLELEKKKKKQPAFHPRCVERVINSSWALASPPPLPICNWMQQRLL